MFGRDSRYNDEKTFVPELVVHVPVGQLECIDAQVGPNPKIDASTRKFCERRQYLEFTRHRSIVERETFSDWMKRQGNESECFRLARFVDKSSSSSHLSFAPAAEITTPQTLVRFTLPGFHALQRYEYPKSFALEAVHGSRINLLTDKKNLFAGDEGRYRSKDIHQSRDGAAGLCLVETPIQLNCRSTARKHKKCYCCRRVPWHPVAD